MFRVTEAIHTEYVTGGSGEKLIAHTFVHQLHYVYDDIHLNNWLYFIIQSIGIPRISVGLYAICNRYRASYAFAYNI